MMQKKPPNMMTKMYIGFLVVFVVLFLAVIATHFLRKKKCLHCKEFLSASEAEKKKRPKEIKWVGYVEKPKEPTDVMSKLLGCVFSNKSFFPLPEKMELCDDCYQARKAKLLEGIDENLVKEAKKEHAITLKKSLVKIAGDPKLEKEFWQKGEPDFRYDPAHTWHHKPDGVRPKFREWD